MAEINLVQEPYRYRSLPRVDCFRLLRIDRLSPYEQHKLRCSLHTFALGDDHLSYDALSYTWGSPLATPECEEAYSSANDVAIYLETDEFHKGFAAIGRNLFDALAHLYRLRLDPGSMEHSTYTSDPASWSAAPYVWVDALCISQVNSEEKGTQVACMAGIYEQATTVFAWLGLDDGTYSDVAWYHNEFLRGLVAWKEEHSQTPTGYDFLNDELRITGPDIVIPASVIKSLASFLTQRRYFNRLWTLQELALAKDIAVLCGSWIFAFMQIADGIYFLTSNSFFRAVMSMDNAPSIPSQPDIDGSAFLRIMGMRRLTGSFESSREELDRNVATPLPDGRAMYCARLYMLIEYSQESKCSNPVDRIFGLLGIANANLPAGFEPLVVADYSKLPGQLFFEITAMLLRHLPRLVVLQSVRHPSDGPLGAGPSWIPTYDQNIPARRTAIFWCHGTDKKTQRNPFNASGRHSYPAGVATFSNAELRLSGRRQCVVQAFSEFLHLPPGVDCTQAIGMAKFIKFLAFVLQSIQTLGPTYWNGQCLSEVVLQTLTIESYSDASLKTGLQAFRSWILGGPAVALSTRFREGNKSDLDEEFYLNIYNILRALDEVSEAQGLPSVRDIAETQEAYDLNGFDERLEENEYVALFLKNLEKMGNTMRRLFRTSSSLGVGPESMRPNDEVWVIIPGQVPFILRPTSEKGRYVLIGDAYLHGIMYGEGVNSASLEDMQDIILA